MKIYNYNFNGEFVNESTADQDPLEPEKFLIPANATTKLPPPPAINQARVFKNNEWDYVPDYRGKVVKANDGSKREITITELGVKPEHVSFEPIDESTVRQTLNTSVTLMLDYLINPTEEKKANLISTYQEIINADQTV